MYALPSRRHFGLVFAVGLGLLLSGCSNYIFQKFDVDEPGNSLSIDAKQRLVFVTHQGGKFHNEKIVCAEPSPDALTAQASD